MARSSGFVRALMFACSLLLAGTCLCRANGIVLLDGLKERSLTEHLSLYRDPSATMSLADVQAAWPAGSFVSRDKRWPALGLTPDAVWARCVLQNNQPESGLWFIQFNSPRMDEVDAYVVRQDGTTRHYVSGSQRDPSPGMVDKRIPAFPVRLSPGEEADVFVRIRSETFVQFPLWLYEAVVFAGQAEREQLVYTGLFGYLFGLIVLGFMFGLISRERGFVFYSFFLVGGFASFYMLSGYYVWQDLPGHRVVAKQGLYVAAEVGLAMVLLYVRSLLDLPRIMPRLNALVVWLFWFGVGLFVLLLFLPFRAAMPVFILHTLLVGLASLVLAVVAWWKGLPAARFYALAWIFFWGFCGVSTLSLLRDHPLPYPVWVFGLAGMVTSSTFFMIALADKVRLIRKAAEETQQQLLALERKTSADLREKMREDQLLIRDLHDGIGGLTANLAILAEVGRRDASQEQDKDRFSRIARLATDGAAEVRTLMSSLEAQEMTWPDFFDECRRQGEVAVRPHGITFEFTELGYDQQPGSGVMAGFSLLRVVKEAMNNAVKYAKCSRLRVEAKFEPSKLWLTIHDNGCGFPAEPGRGRGMGNMESRVREMGGRMTCRNAGGAEVLIELPLPVALVNVQELKTG